MQIKVEYTKDGIKLTHPSGVIEITTLDALRRDKEDMQVRIKKSEEMLQDIGKDILSIINAGAR